MGEVYPGWRKTYDEYFDRTPMLEKRDDYWKRNYHCAGYGNGLFGQEWHHAKGPAISEGSQYLRRQPGPGGIGNKGCGRFHVRGILAYGSATT